MRPPLHAAISVSGGVVIGWWFHSVFAGFAFIVGGVFYDVDHFLDYYVANKKISLRYRDWVHYCETNYTGRLLLIFHSYEFLILLWAMLYYYGSNFVGVSLALGITIHFFCDQFYNPLKPMAYFFVYRMCYRFKRNLLFKDGYFEKIHS